MTQIEASKLFNNVEQIYEVNLAFWTEHLSKVVEYVSVFLPASWVHVFYNIFTCVLEIRDR